jgi:hypothetical protein
MCITTVGELFAPSFTKKAERKVGRNKKEHYEEQVFCEIRHPSHAFPPDDNQTFEKKLPR